MQASLPCAGFPYDTFNIEDAMLPADDDMGIPSEDDEEVEQDVQTETGFGCVIVVDNLPTVPPEKVDKLTTVLKKLFGQIGTIREGGLWMPADEATKLTKGFAFVEYLQPEEAHAARDMLQGYKLDKSHTFVVNMFDEFEQFAKVPDQYEEPEEKPYRPMENLQEWLMDRRGRDQFAIRYGDETEIYWNDHQKALAEEVYKRSFWTESFVQWSPKGSYLGTVHTRGVAVWGGPSFARLQRFTHTEVRLVDFSPNERYLISYSSQDPSNPREKATVIFNVFDLKTGRKLRNFTGSVDEFAVGTAAGPAGVLRWPVFKWAGGKEDKYFARMNKNAISIYEAPDMGLLDKKSLKLDAVQDFAWSPTDSIMCAYQSEQAGGNLPARLSLIKLPERQELRQKNLFSVSAVQMFWHPQGDYLAVQVDRYTKTRKSTYTSFELFSLKDSVGGVGIPMEVLELPSKADKIVDFQWEPRGSRFAILHGDGPRPTFSVYAMRQDLKSSVRGVSLVGSQPSKQANCMFWSPQGKYMVLAGLKGMNGQLEFFNVDDFEPMSAAEHFMCTDVEWDPTGRFVATSVGHIHQMENGFNVWLFNGTELHAQKKERFLQFSWRPRPDTLLSPEQEAAIQKDFKKFSKKYQEEDELIHTQADADVIEGRKRLQTKWDEWCESRKEYADQLAQGKRKILAQYYSLDDDDYTIQEVETETQINYHEEVLKGDRTY
eukprot:jgi/Astpho2/6248/Aster-03652